ncbi:MAG: hypothetical protein JXA09_14590 [Anaerolineae bacterium]|nr:hypothetical protein [Anaerolineae bacterium]
MTDPATVAAILLSALALVTLGLSLRRRAFFPRTALPIALFVLLSLVWMASGLIVDRGWVPAWRAPAPVTRRLLLYGACTLALAFLYLVLVAVRRAPRAWVAWAAGGAWIAGTVAVDAAAWRAPGANAWQLAYVASGLLIAGALVPTAIAALLSLLALRDAGTADRPRALYWALAALLVAAGAGLVLVGYNGGGIGVHAAALWITACALGARAPGRRRAQARAMLSYVLAVALSGGAYVGMVFALARAAGAAVGRLIWVGGTAAALCLALAFQPIRRMLERLLRRIAGIRYDPARVVRAYGARIDGTLDLGALSEALIDVVAENLDVERSVLFVVHPPEEGAGGGYRLEAVGAAVPADLIHGVLRGESPLARYLQVDLRPLTREELDAPPLLGDLAAEERAWLVDIGCVYVSIRARGEWIGLLAAGEKRAEDAYRTEDLDLLARLGERTALPLRNARAARELQRLNTELRRTCLEEEQRREELLRTMAALRQERDALEDEGRIQDGFLAAIAERLRMPFANLDFALQLMERYGLDGWTVDQRDQLVQLKQEVGKAKQMADNVVAFAALLGEDSGIEVAELDIAALIEAALRPLRAQADQRALRLEVQAPTELPPVLGDQDRLVDALYQLVHNAISFARPGGAVRVRCWADARALHLEVTDNGAGTRRADLDALWTDFAPAHADAGGLGLGLPLTHRIVRVHGGQVYARSDPGVGSTFGFQIPLRDQPRAGEEAEDVATLERRDERWVLERRDEG